VVEHGTFVQLDHEKYCQPLPGVRLSGEAMEAGTSSAVRNSAKRKFVSFMKFLSIVATKVHAIRNESDVHARLCHFIRNPLASLNLVPEPFVSRATAPNTVRVGAE
jgi:hypothetical protein